MSPDKPTGNVPVRMLSAASNGVVRAAPPLSGHWVVFRSARGGQLIGDQGLQLCHLGLRGAQLVA